MMIRRSTWIILLIFAGFLAVFFWNQQRQTAQPAEPTPTDRPRVVAVDAGDIVGVTMSNASGMRIAIQRSAGGTWVMTEPETEEIDQPAVSTLLAQVSTLNALNRLENELDKQAVGLDQPAYVVTAEMSDGTQLTLSIGAKTVTSSGYYVQLNNDQIFVVSTLDVNDLLEAINDPEYFVPPTPTPEPTPES